MLLANLLLLAWDYHRLQHLVLPAPANDDGVAGQTGRFPVWFFGCVLAAIVAVVAVNQVMFEIRRGNSRLECTSGCDGASPMACQRICACIYDDGKPLSACLDEFQARQTEPRPSQAPAADRSPADETAREAAGLMLRPD